MTELPLFWHHEGPPRRLSGGTAVARFGGWRGNEPAWFLWRDGAVVGLRKRWSVPECSSARNANGAIFALPDSCINRSLLCWEMARIKG